MDDISNRPVHYFVSSRFAMETIKNTVSRPFKIARDVGSEPFGSSRVGHEKWKEIIKRNQLL